MMASSSAPGTQSTQATQGGSGTGPTTLMISGVQVNFPCKAYPSQMAMMSKVIQGLKSRKNCLLESPTGSGKTLALLCSALAWQQHEAVRVEQHNDEIDARQEAAIARKTEEIKKKQQQDRSEKQKSVIIEQSTELGNDQSNASLSLDASAENSNANPVFELTDDEDDDFKPTKRTRVSPSSTINKSNCTSDSIGDDEALKENAKKSKTEVPQQNDPNAPYFVPYEKKLVVPKIFFGTRTHKQISQITRELRKTSYRNARSVVLASRDHTCVNPAVEKLANKNEACRELVQNGQINGNGCMWHAGAKKLASFSALSAAGLAPAYDVEDLVAIGRKHKSCPYYVTRFLMANTDIIFCPYNYMIDPSIRKSMNLDLTGHVIIFDEAHNMEDASRESASFSLMQDDIQRAIQDCEKVGASGNEPYAHAEISKFLSTLSQWINMESHNLKEKSFNSAAKCWTGTLFVACLDASGITTDCIKHFTAFYQAIVAQRDKQMEGQRERGGRWMDDKPVISNQSLSVVGNVFRLFNDLSGHEGKFRDDFRVALSKDTVKRRRDGNSGPVISVQVLTLHLWCLNPAVAFEELRKTVHSIVLTSGTLSPMQSFESELGVPFTLKLEASHVIDKSQVWASVVGIGPNGHSLNGSYRNTETMKYQDELGLILHRTCEIMPHGVLCFFPSYRMLESLINRWRVTGLLDKIEFAKAVSVEPRSGADAFQEAMDCFYAAVQDTSKINSATQTGALFLAVCRGKVSEGLDFADNNARAVICVGIPFPNFKDMQVELKREYNNRNGNRGLLSGGDWYEIQAFRALNQALGRCIRHRNDWGAILLIDDRYIQTPRYVNSLSKWIRSSVKKFPTWSSLENSLKEFRDNMLNSERHLALNSTTFEETLDESLLKGNCSHDGACGCSNGSWLGMNKDSSDNKASSCNRTIVPFANSFSSNGSLPDDLDSNPCEDSVQLVNESKTPVPKDKYVSIDFTTPSPVFSKGRKGNRAEAQNVPPSTPTIASMFAKQVQRRQQTSGPQNFVPDQVSFSKSVSEVSNVPDRSEGRLKRPREKKLRL